MAIQLLGIPFLAGIFGSVILGLISFLAQFMTKRIAIAIAGIAAVVTVTGAFVGAISALVATIQFSFPDYEYAFLFLPSNFQACFGAIVAAKVLRWAYDWNIKIIQWKLF
ncbi:minor coat protein [Marinobacter sp. M3C]|jgi:hypothetical protein|uniref:DUF5455 family protein n=1 Tax=Marinobacter sp. M3C TaxID=2917715 RepID=UPI00200D1148|nr:DUF5455 family protein [Marinobacter sp. M3C]MCL1478318.1 minor coat protein [Marinobacter sp.]MCL1480277.1 minor coat protein [Marinobacter sp.]MCL1483852.1 minor coat protein [Marinobacter sp.]UQG59170.1 minor coat protein [Marinobacter sp. M3C]